MAVSFRGRGQGSAARDLVRNSRGTSIGPVMQPRRYHEARSIGERFRSGQPVIMDLSGLSDTDARRLVDFAAGLIFGLRGSIDKIANRVFLLTPAGNGPWPEPWDSAAGSGAFVITAHGHIVSWSGQGEQAISEDGTGKTVDSGDLLDVLDAAPAR
jgi:hypothetical protein